MPVYEYRCKSCGETHEILHGFNDDRPTKCPTCGGELIRIFHPIGVVFKGSGFHKTDYAKSGARPASSDSSEAKPADSKPAEGKPAESKPGESKSPDSKPSESKSGESKSGESRSSESTPTTGNKPAKAP